MSAIIPTYNRADYVATAIDSVLAQTHPRVEAVVVDDGSTDATRSVLESYGDRIAWVSQKNCGASAARNRGIEESSGDIVTFLDSDDIWCPDKLAKQVAVLQRAGASVPVCVTNARLHGLPGREGTQLSFDIASLRPDLASGLWTNVQEVLSSRFLFFTQTVAIRREALDTGIRFDESLQLNEDYDLSLQLARLGHWAFLREPLVEWNGGSDLSLTSEASLNTDLLQSSLVCIYEKFLSDPERLSPLSRKNLERNLAHARALRQWARMQGESSGSLSRATKALQLHYYRTREKIYRRSGSYPQMCISPLDPTAS